jgi:predicted enzyme related to lactoylglutathione lyase
MEAVDVRGRFVWHQLLTRDVPGAKKFYSGLVGWKAQPWPLDPGYIVCHAGDVPTAGMMEMTLEVPAEAPPHWLQYIGTRDVDGTAEAAVRAGGSIIKPPSDMQGAGRYAVLQDPQGAVFAIIDPENARAEPAGVPPLASFSWHELATTDHEAAFAFYSNLFGWDAITRMDMGPLGIYLIFGQNGAQKGGIYIKPPDAPGPAHWLAYLRVPDVDVSAKEAQAVGAKLCQGPMEVPDGSRIAVLTDPSGAAIAIHSTPAEGDTSAAASTSTSTSTSGSASPAVAPARARPKRKAKAKPTPQVKTKSRSKAKAKVKAKAKRKTPTKSAKKSARKSARKSAKKSPTRAKPRAGAKVKIKRTRAPMRRKKKGKSVRRKK